MPRRAETLSTRVDPPTSRPGAYHVVRGLAAVLCALVAFVALGVAPRPADAQYFGQNKVQYRSYAWHSFSSDHFTIYTYDGLDSVAMRVMDLAEKANVMLSQRMGHQLGHKVPIILYGSHNDFSQTNVTPELIEGSTGGFTEVYRNRVVVPFTGSYEDLRHVVVHELVHAYMFDLLYGGAAGTLIARQSFFSPPLWFAEGLAEYLSLGTEANEEMFLRDGTLESYLPPLQYSGGYIVYKQGQSAIRFLVERYGEDRLRELLRQIRTYRSFDNAFQRSIGTTVAKFDEQWREWLKKRYWPSIQTKSDPDVFARRLTDHRHDQSNLNTAPAISPDGDRIAYYSDRRQYTDVYVMSAFDGKVLRRLIRGEQSVKFESVPSFRSSLTWSPDGRQVAMTAKSQGEDHLYLVDAGTGKVRRTLVPPCEALAYPAWSPRSADSLVVCGVHAGRSDLYLVDARAGTFTRLTDDTWDEKEPVWTADGNGITFASDRGTPVVLFPQRLERGFGRYAIYTLDLATRTVHEEVHTGGDDHSPAWSGDGTRLAFVSDFNGTPNAFLYRSGDSTVAQLTDVRGGIMSLSWSRGGDRLVFTGYDRGGFDVFAVREPLSSPGTLERIRRDMPASLISLNRAQEPPADSAVVSTPSLGALAGSWPDTLMLAADTLAARPMAGLPPEGADSTMRRPRLTADAPRWSGPSNYEFAALPDTGPPLPETHALVERGGPFEIPDTLLAQQPTPYKVRFSADFAGGTLYGGDFGVLGATQIALSDFLGDRRIDLALGLYSNSLSDANAVVVYSYLPRRWDYSVAVFHYKDYFESRVTALGEQFASPKLFSDRNYGLALGAAYPTSRFHRYEIGLVQKFVDRTFFEEDDFGFLVRTDKQKRSVSAVTLSKIGDYTLWGYYGPVNGHRYNITYQESFDLGGNSLPYRTATLDWRRYIDLTHGYTFATRMLGGVSGGKSPQTFRIGGFSTLRGYGDYSLFGTRIAVTNLEMRFPFIQQLGLVGPLPLGLFNLKGAAFADAGLNWNDGDPVRLFGRDPDGRRQMQDLRFDFGTGIRTYIFYFPIRVDVGWRWDLVNTSKPRWQVVLGPEF
jgi:Tol biopolymer transport system component